MNLKTLARVVVYDRDDKKILLVKNKNANYWYAPGGGWEFEKENILEAARREVKEETGLDVEIKKLLYVQEFHATEDVVFFETFWLAEPLGCKELNDQHIDLDPNGQVEQARWFSRKDLQDLKFFPERLRNNFWDNVESVLEKEDAFIGVS